ncbi:putative GTPase activating protein for arf domain-containing protein [Ditylenchus destructor]|uniref:GTPase activating protein for arf domain-containing protein n=1 Tax=Ditylenchus destructor TaxID=166010 RepID=A0AAD4N1G7_9BILA|nr:putative GTPase activating protein for arf domain-containing protein [Ditylenchus destructor]
MMDLDKRSSSGDEFSTVCADCGSAQPKWASINRGVLICSECCYVHRNLGRHISQVRSLKKGVWYANQLALLDVLYKSGSNNIWEHTLLDPQNENRKSKKKPVSNDPIIPKKEAFIKAKYVQLAFAIRPSKEDLLTVDELNKQMWSCVRTSHVETTLRLLALGADPNYADPDKGNTPLHVAAKEGQILQIELLSIYGADIAQPNAAGQTPANVARQENHTEVADRLDELEFEVTDRFSMFLCGRAPDHKQNQHFLIPELVGQPSEHVKQFRKLMQNTSSPLLERLVQDIFDEVDRREINAQWVAAEQYRLPNHQHVAVFLPPNQKLSATRNQLRQKLAKFDSRDFSQLVIDLLKEIRRRYFCLPLPPSDKTEALISALQRSSDNGIDLDDSRDYDEVADISFRKSRSASSRRSSTNKESGDPIINHLALDNYLELKEKMAESDERLNAIVQTNNQLMKNFQAMQRIMEQLQHDQIEIRHELKALSQSDMSASRRIASPLTLRTHTDLLRSPSSPTTVSEIGAVVMPASSVLASKVSMGTFPPKPSRGNPRFAYRQNSLTSPSESSGVQADQTTTTAIERTQPHSARSSQIHFRAQSTTRNGSAPPAGGDGESSTTSGEYTQNTTTSTSGIKAFFNDGGNHDCNAVFHSDSISHHINRILRLIPPFYMAGIVQVCASEMDAAMTALRKKCLSRPLNTNETVHAAYDVAKAAKQLLVTVHSRADFS